MLKYPKPGQVKTRLARDIGIYKAALLYRCFVETMIATCVDSGSPVLLFCHSGHELGKYRQWLGHEHNFFSQSPGGHLGNKMRSIFEQAFTMGYEKVVLTGTDLPHIPVTFLRQAIRGLERHEAVIGPARDGGYYLIGFRRESFVPLIFKDMPWSTSSVLDLTLKLLKSLSVDPYVLPTLRDVDDIEDLKEIFGSDFATLM